MEAVLRYLVWHPMAYWTMCLVVNVHFYTLAIFECRQLQSALGFRCLQSMTHRTHAVLYSYEYICCICVFCMRTSYLYFILCSSEWSAVFSVWGCEVGEGKVCIQRFVLESLLFGQFAMLVYYANGSLIAVITLNEWTGKEWVRRQEILWSICANANIMVSFNGRNWFSVEPLVLITKSGWINYEFRWNKLKDWSKLLVANLLVAS